MLHSILQQMNLQLTTRYYEIKYYLLLYKYFLFQIHVAITIGQIPRFTFTIKYFETYKFSSYNCLLKISHSCTFLFMAEIYQNDISNSIRQTVIEIFPTTDFSRFYLRVPERIQIVIMSYVNSNKKCVLIRSFLSCFSKIRLLSFFFFFFEKGACFYLHNRQAFNKIQIFLESKFQPFF